MVNITGGTLATASEGNRFTMFGVVAGGVGTDIKNDADIHKNSIKIFIPSIIHGITFSPFPFASLIANKKSKIGNRRYQKKNPQTSILIFLFDSVILSTRPKINMEKIVPIIARVTFFKSSILFLAGIFHHIGIDTIIKRIYERMYL